MIEYVFFMEYGKSKSNQIIEYSRRNIDSTFIPLIVLTMLHQAFFIKIYKDNTHIRYVI